MKKIDRLRLKICDTRDTLHRLEMELRVEAEDVILTELPTTLPELREREFVLVQNALELEAGHRRRAAKRLGISERSIYRILKKLKA